MSVLSHSNLVEWLNSCNCVKDGRVIIDVRSAWPTAFIGMRATSIDSRYAFIEFITLNLEVN
jgi:hypothetical protein